MKILNTALRMLVAMTLLTGVLYPLAITGVAKVLFGDKAGGSIVVAGGRKVGSALIAQRFSASKYFRPRPSAVDYATLPSGASNRGFASAALKKDYDQRLAYWRGVIAGYAPGGKHRLSVPPDMLFASGSGLDPHISPEAARMQVERVAAARGFSAEQKIKLSKLVEKHVEKPILGFMGEPRINALLLNLDLDGMK